MIFEGERVAIQNKFKNGMLHGQKVSFFCKNKEKKCSYTEDAQCIDGTIEIPANASRVSLMLECLAGISLALAIIST